MPSNFHKLWPSDTANQIAIQRAGQAIGTLGQALPCEVVAVTGAIVTVSFQAQSAPWALPQVTIPKAESPWIRMPTQVGDLGVTIPASWYLGGISDLGGGVADTAQPMNLSALVFVPVSNAGSPPINQGAAQIQGPDGVILQTTTGTTSSAITNTSGTVITFGTTTLTINASGVTIDVNGKVYSFTQTDATLDGIPFGTHAHAYYPGTGNQTDTGGPV